MAHIRSARPSADGAARRADRAAPTRRPGARPTDGARPSSVPEYAIDRPRTRQRRPPAPGQRHAWRAAGSGAPCSARHRRRRSAAAGSASSRCRPVAFSRPIMPRNRVKPLPPMSYTSARRVLHAQARASRSRHGDRTRPVRRPDGVDRRQRRERHHARRDRPTPPATTPAAPALARSTPLPARPATAVVARDISMSNGLDARRRGRPPPGCTGSRVPAGNSPSIRRAPRISRRVQHLAVDQLERLERRGFGGAHRVDLIANRAAQRARQMRRRRAPLAGVRPAAPGGAGPCPGLSTARGRDRTFHSPVIDRSRRRTAPRSAAGPQGPRTHSSRAGGSAGRARPPASGRRATSAIVAIRRLTS